MASHLCDRGIAASTRAPVPKNIALACYKNDSFIRFHRKDVRLFLPNY